MSWKWTRSGSGSPYTLYKNSTQVASTNSSPYTFSGLACGTSYTLGVKPAKTGTTTKVTASTSACPDVQPPAAPGGVNEVSGTPTSISLAWTASSDNVGVAGYDVYHNGAVDGSTGQTSYTVSGLTCGTSYTVAVDAYDMTGNTSAKTAVSMPTSACASTIDTQAPSVPTNQTIAAATTTSLAMTWSPSTDNVGVTGYHLSLNGTKVADTTATGYTYTGLTCGTTYTVGLQAYDAAGNSSNLLFASGAATTAACASPPPPPPPTDTQTPSVPANQTISGSTTTSLAMTWSPSTDNVGVTGYHVWLNGTKVADTTATSYTYTGLTCGTTYTAGLQAYDAAGNSSSVVQASTTGTTAACAPPPPPPPPSGASVYLSPTGNDSNPCTQAAPCLTLQRGSNVAASGATIALAAGQYPGGQSLTGTKTLTFSLDPNAVIGDISGPGNTNIHASNVEFDGGQIPSVALQNAVSSNVTFRNVNGGRMWIDNASTNISWIGGDLGPNKCSGGAQTYLNTIMNGSHILFDGVNIHDQKVCSSGEHTESLRIDQGSSFVTVRNSTFSNNDDSTSAIFVTTQSQGVGEPHDITVTGNTFGTTTYGGWDVESQNPNVTVCTNYNVQNNRYAMTETFLLFQCPTSSNVVTGNNVGF